MAVAGCAGRGWDVLAVLGAPPRASSIPGAGWCCCLCPELLSPLCRDTPAAVAALCLPGLSSVGMHKGWQQPWGCGSAVPHVGQMPHGGQRVPLVSLWGQLSGHWCLEECPSASWAFSAGVPHCRFVCCFFPLPFQLYFLNFTLILPHLQPHNSCRRLCTACYTSPAATFMLPVFPHLISRVLGTGAI